MGREYYRKRKALERKIILGAVVLCLVAVAAFAFFIIRANDSVSAASSEQEQTTLTTTEGESETTVEYETTTVTDTGDTEAEAETEDDDSVLKTVQVSLTDAATPLWISVSIADQTLTVYDANNEVVECWLCSTGSPGYDTPTGTFSVYKRGKSFYSEKYQEGAYYYVAFYKGYYIHSVPFDANGDIMQSIADDLGHEDSHGCVHLTIANAKWVYDNIPDGTSVVVTDE